MSVKNGERINRGIADMILDRYNNSKCGPICCSYIHRQKDIRDKKFQKGYIDLSDFRLLASDTDETVIGCTRGCLPLNNSREGKRQYLKELCEGCVLEMKEYLNLNNGANHEISL